MATEPFPILYSFRRCPYAMRARMALLVSGISWELREVVLRDKPAEMIVASPKATVPVLVLPDGGVIDESIEIMREGMAGVVRDNFALKRDERFELVRQRYALNVRPCRGRARDEALYRHDGFRLGILPL